MLSPGDVWAILQVKYFRHRIHKNDPKDPTLVRCWELLRHSSRSFVAVIEEIHPELRNPMMIFYLVLRGLDTIEDDTGLDLKIKLPLLRNFRKEVLTKKDWTFHDSSPTEKDRIVLQQFDLILKVFHGLRPEYQDIIADIAHVMGNGMADFITRESSNLEGLETVKDYNLYCHYVAGVVGEGISRMAIVARFASSTVAEKPQLFESMGLFLQKTNIIRDYREDLDDGRSFWPQEVWRKYAKSLGDFRTDTTAGKHCISELLIFSLLHVTDCLEYLANVSEPSVFRFCAIPQVMSIATLELVFNNEEVLRRHVKISKGLASRLILASGEMGSVYKIFFDFVMKIHQKNDPTDPNYVAIEQVCAKIIQYINTHDEDSEAAILRAEIMDPVKQRKPFLGLVQLTDDEIEGAKILAFCFCVCMGIMFLMMGVAMLFGAKFPNPFRVLKGGIQFPNRVDL